MQMGIGAVDAPAVREALLPFVEELRADGASRRAVQTVVDLAMRCVKREPSSRPTIEVAMTALKKLSSSHQCPDLMNLQASVVAIAALEDELEEYAQRLREHQEASSLGPNKEGVDSTDMELIDLSRESDLRFSRSFIGNTNHVMNSVMPRLRAEVDKAAAHGRHKRSRDGVKVGIGDLEKKATACLIM